MGQKTLCAEEERQAWRMKMTEVAEVATKGQKYRCLSCEGDRLWTELVGAEWRV